MKKYADKMAYLHFKNVDFDVFPHCARAKSDSDTAFDRDVMCDLRDGIIDFNALRHHRGTGFEGIGVIEQDMPRATTEQAFAAARRNLTICVEIHLTTEKRRKIKMHIVVCKDYEEMSRRAAEIVAEQIKSAPTARSASPAATPRWAWYTSSRTW